MRVALLRVAMFFVCIIMGVNAPTIYAQLGTFKSTGPMVVNRTGPTVTLLHNGTVLVTGGSDGANALSSAEIFNPVSGTFRLTKGSMSTPRYGNTATLLSDGRVLIEGGYDHIPTASDPALDSAEIYDPDTDSFLPAGRMQTRHTLNRAKEVLLNNGQVLLAGGEANWTASGCFPVLSTAQLFDPNTNRFSFTTGNLTTSRQESEETLLLTGRVLLSGGFDTDCNILGSAELYDPVFQKFTSTGNLNFSRLGHASTLLPDGRVLVTGGLPGVSLISAENYANGIFTSSNGTLTHSRFNHTSTLLDDGTVLLVGGTGDVGSSKTAEIYDPATDSFRPTVGSMASSYSGHRAVKLRNGNVLLIGGGNPEIYIFTNAQESNSVWPMTGHDPQRTGLSPFTGPKSAPAKPSWTYPTGAAVIGDLAISAEGIIYFSSDKLYALNQDGTPYVQAVPISPLTSPTVDDINQFVYVTARNATGGYDVLRYSKQLQNPTVVFSGTIQFGVLIPTPSIIGPDGTIYFSNGVSVIAVGPRTWISPGQPFFGPCFGNPGLLTPTLGHDGSVYSMCQPGGGSGFGSGIYRFDGLTGAQIGFASYSRGGTELIIDTQNRLRAGFQAFNGIILFGSYDTWDANLNQLTPTGQGSFTTSRSALFPDGFSTIRIGFSFQSNGLDATGAHIWGVPSGAQTLPNFSTVPTTDASGNVFVGTVSGVAALSGTDGSTLWFNSLTDTITTQPIISASGTLFVGSSSGKVYAFDSKPTTGTIVVSTNNAAATFTITGPVNFTGTGTSFVYSNAPTGQYTIAYGNIDQHIAPPAETKILVAGETLTFNGSYTPITLSACAANVAGCTHSLTFVVPAGFVGPISPQKILVSSNAPSLAFLATTSTNQNSHWLSIAPMAGVAPASLDVIVSGNLPPGTYNGQITVTAPSATNSPEVISVSLVITSAPKKAPPHLVVVLFIGAALSGAPADPNIGDGLKQLLNEIMTNPALPGAVGKIFSHKQFNDAIGFVSSNLGEQDALIIIGHSAGGDTARSFAEYISKASFASNHQKVRVKELVAIDPIDLSLGNLNQAFSPKSRPNGVDFVLGFYQRFGDPDLLLGITPCGIFDLVSICGYRIVPADLEYRYDVPHTQIDNDARVHQNIMQTLTNIFH
jgi:PQQ-like domain/Kelch motif/Galactose oxidase, central domain